MIVDITNNKDCDSLLIAAEGEDVELQDIV
jgi:hypothetical protein